ncbi:MULTISPECIES: DUF6932 family protein [Bacillus]|uniref:DUF6932 family protein n=1 Tax=Bacillus TaxID=1386 RepID=UPI0018E9F798|nr:hypothetical protein [Bacillus subtilis]MBJ3804351.1 hypothetical protein [Bacillus subtilis]MBR0019671.1 hypothetical protein [Bacillus subtilis]MEC2386126.1 hypothetical protein [Bacillus subtilis]MED4522355.1 hypothetical protein [Bacillus subtilis]MED4620807.1 hypothetical protein [Bacillus subtilis]
MTIPNFFDDYHLPPGEHICTMEEISTHFVSNEVRTRRWEDFVQMLKRICNLKLIPEEVLINGSFVTGRQEPGDVDFAVLIPPDTVRAALKAEDEHDVEGVRLFVNPNNQVALRNLFGAHLLIADTKENLSLWSSLFRKGQYGKLREPDYNKDPEWVTRPDEKGILKVTKTDIINFIGGEG